MWLFSQQYFIYRLVTQCLSCANGIFCCSDYDAGVLLQCYTLMKNSKPFNFKGADEECQTVKGTLVTISDQVEQGENVNMLRMTSLNIFV